MKKSYKLSAVLIIFLSFLISGCLHGPVRYKTLGFHKYATVEFTKRSPLVLKPFAAPAGLFCDGIITVVDIPINLIRGVPLVFTHGGPDGAGCMNEITIGIVTFPFWYPIMLFVMNVEGREMYKEIWGKETGIYRDVDIEYDEKDPLKILN